MMVIETMDILSVYGKGRCWAMELGGEECDVEEAGKFAEYKMNVVLGLLGAGTESGVHWV